MDGQTEQMRPRGRPRAVQPEKALDTAMRAFWADGYDTVSIDRLCRETGMTRTSLYQDYGGKEGLFLAAIGHYVRTRVALLTNALGPKGTLEADLREFFDAVMDLATCHPAMPGCLISCVLAEVAGGNETFREELDRRFSALEGCIVRRLDIDGGPAPRDTAAVAGMLAAVARGITLRARSGAGRATLEPIAEIALQSALCRLR
jgi:TetR/AcrR family transcriptional repressor of nem operon